MDRWALPLFQVTDPAAGNAAGVKGLDTNLRGPRPPFLGPPIVALCGATMGAKLDREAFTVPGGQEFRSKRAKNSRLGKPPVVDLAPILLDMSASPA